VGDESPRVEGAGLFVYSRHEDDAVDVRLWGELDAAGAPTVDREFSRILVDVRPSSVVVVDTTALTFIDSIGIRALLRARQGVAQRGGRFRFVASEALRRLVALLGAEELLVDS
jgi:anti-sigma B factor antagonist